MFPRHLLSDEAAPFDCASRSWWVLHTRPRQEKSLARELYRREIPFYLPLERKRSKIRGRNFSSQLPLFPGYVFLLAGDEERWAALDTSRVLHTLRVTDQGGLWRDLRQVERLNVANLPVTLEKTLVPGDFVEIIAGPLAGLRGKIVQGASGARFVVEVDFIRQGAAVLVDAATLIRTEKQTEAPASAAQDRRFRPAS